MATEVVVYSKQIDKPPVPITVRIEWLSDGAIKPLMYWTPDGTCYQVILQYECISLSFLKERGEGLRFMVRTEIIETDEPDSIILHTQQDTYLYLADKRFCEKNIVDGRYGHTGKEYIPIMLDVFSDGGYALIYFWVQDRRYKVERTTAIEPRGSFQAGGIGLWHKVEARLVNEYDDGDPDPKNIVTRIAAVYLELNKWFVCVAKNLGYASLRMEK